MVKRVIPPEYYDGEPSIPQRTPAAQAQYEAAVAAGIARLKAILAEPKEEPDD
jgi:hypothetical protein